MVHHQGKMTKILTFLLCLGIVGYLSYEWVMYFQGIESENNHEFVGFLYFVGGYCLVLFLLIMLGYAIYIYRARVMVKLPYPTKRLYALAIYLILFLGFWLVVRDTFSSEGQFVPENMLLAGVGLAIVIISKKLFEASRQKQLQLTYEKDKRQAELSLLKAQVNPHFLFNALNTLYNDALKIGANQMTTNLEMLTDILRYQLQYASQQTISLKEEMNFIRQFVDFQKHRFQADTTINLSLDITMETPDLLIHPMILITFVENAFKHGISREHQSVVAISIVQRLHDLTLKVQNTNFPKEGKVSSGIGLEQTKRLLDAHYPDHQYQTRENVDEYHVSLILNLESR